MRHPKRIAIPPFIFGKVFATTAPVCAIVGSATSVIPLVKDLRDQGNRVLLLSDINEFVEGLKALVFDPSLSDGYRMEPGWAAAIYANDPVILVIDCTQVDPSKQSSLNELFDDIRSFLGQPIGKNIKIMSVVTTELGIEGLASDCYSRMTYSANLTASYPAEENHDLFTHITIPQIAEIQDAMVIEFFEDPDWRKVLLGAPTIGEDGLTTFKASPWIKSLQNGENRKLVLKNAPVAHKGFVDFLLDIQHRNGHTICVNGQTYATTPQPILFCNGYATAELSNIDSTLVSEFDPTQPNFVINESTIGHVFSSVRPNAEGQIRPMTGILHQLAMTGGTLTINGPIPSSRKHALCTQIAKLNATPGAKKIGVLCTNTNWIDKLNPQRLTVTHDPIAATTQRLTRTPEAVMIDIGYATKPEDVIEYWQIHSFRERQYAIDSGTLKTALDAGKSVIVRGIESNKDCLKQLETLFENPPYLWSGGQKWTYQADQLHWVCTPMSKKLAQRVDPTVSTKTQDVIPRFNHATDKEAALKKAIVDHRFVLIEGPPGSSKTYFAEKSAAELNAPDTDVWSLSAAPDSNPDHLIGCWQRNGSAMHDEIPDDRLTFRNGPIMTWATRQPSQDGQYLTLVINEVNLAPKGFWNFLLGLAEPSPALDLGPFKINLTPFHRVVFTQNPAGTIGRQNHSELMHLSYKMVFDAESTASLSPILEKTLDTRGIQDPQKSEIIDHVTQKSLAIATIRDWIDDVEMAAARLNGQISDAQDIQQRLSNAYPDFNFGNESTTQLATTVWNRLAIARGTPNFKGKRGLLIEGPPGRGKDAVIDRVTQEYTKDPDQIRRMTCKTGADYFDMTDQISAAKAGGKILIISELNLLPSAIAEGLLNDALSGTSHPEFFLFLTINSGRQPFSEPFKNRLECVQIDDYSESDLYDLVSHRVSQSETATDADMIARQLVDFHTHLLTHSQNKGLRVHPTSRELFRTLAELERQKAWQSPSRVLDFTYRLNMLRLGIPSSQQILAPESDDDTDSLTSHDSENTEQEDTDQASTTTETPNSEKGHPSRKSESSAKESAPLTNEDRDETQATSAMSDTVSEGATDRSAENSPETILVTDRHGNHERVDMSSQARLSPEDRPSLKSERPDKIDLNGNYTQTQEDIDNTMAYFTFHPDVRIHNSEKREYRIFVYDHIDEDLNIGRASTDPRNLLHFTSTYTAKSLVIDTIDDAIGTIEIPAGNPREIAALPSLSPYETLTEYSTSSQTRLNFYRDKKNNLYYVSLPKTALTLRYKIHLPESARYSYESEFSLFTQPKTMSKNVMPTSLRALCRDVAIESILDLQPTASYAEKILKITTYCSRFTQGRIPEENHPSIQDAIRQDTQKYDDATYKMMNLILRKTGVCRHRTWAFLALASYFGIECRIIGNHIHNLIEIRVHKHGSDRWIKVELSQFGFRTFPTNWRPSDIEKTTILQFKDTITNAKRFGRRVINKSVEIGGRQVTSLEALVNANFLPIGVRQASLMAYCDRNTLPCTDDPQQQLLNPKDLAIEMPECFDDTVIEIVQKSVDAWSNLTHEKAYEYLPFVVHFLTTLSHKCATNTKLIEPLNQFYRNLLQRDLNEAQAIAVMDVIFSMKSPHLNHLNEFLIQREGFDFFLQSQHTALFHERVANHYYTSEETDDRALVTSTEVNISKGLSIGNRFVTSNFDQKDGKQLLEIQRKLLVDLIKHLKLDLSIGQIIYGFNETLISTGQLNITDAYIESAQTIEKQSLTKSDSDLMCIFFRPIWTYCISERFSYENEIADDQEKQRLSTLWETKFIPINYKPRKKLLVLILESRLMQPILEDSDRRSAALSQYDQLCYLDAESNDIQSLDLRHRLAERSKKIALLIDNGQHTPNKLEATNQLVQGLILSCPHENTGAKHALLTTIFSSDYSDSVETLRGLEKDAIPGLVYALLSKTSLFLTLIAEYSRSLDRLGIVSELSPTTLNQIKNRIGMTTVLDKGYDLLTYGHFAATLYSEAWRGHEGAMDTKTFQELLKISDTLDKTPLHTIIDNLISSIFEANIMDPEFIKNILSMVAYHNIYKKYVWADSLDTYIKNLLIRNIPFGNLEPHPHTATDLPHFELMLQKLFPGRTPSDEDLFSGAMPTTKFSYSVGKFHHGRFIEGKSFFERIEFETQQVPIVIRGAIQLDSSIPLETENAFFSELWRRSGHQVTFATGLGTETPKTFSDYSRLIRFFSIGDGTNFATVPRRFIAAKYPNHEIL
jgi:MoxR-like ATPase